jgi:hypothetical protein
MVPSLTGPRSARETQNHQSPICCCWPCCLPSTRFCFRHGNDYTATTAFALARNGNEPLHRPLRRVPRQRHYRDHDNHCALALEFKDEGGLSPSRSLSLSGEALEFGLGLGYGLETPKALTSVHRPTVPPSLSLNGDGVGRIRPACTVPAYCEPASASAWREWKWKWNPLRSTPPRRRTRSLWASVSGYRYRPRTVTPPFTGMSANGSQRVRMVDREASVVDERHAYGVGQGVEHRGV